MRPRILDRAGRDVALRTLHPWRAGRVWRQRVVLTLALVLALVLGVLATWRR